MKSEIKIKTAANAETVIGILEDLVKSFKEGTVVLEKENEFVSLTPGNDFQVEIEAGRKKNKQKFSLELSWVLTESKEENPPEFKISSQEPEIKAPEAEKEEDAESNLQD